MSILNTYVFVILHSFVLEVLHRSWSKLTRIVLQYEHHTAQ